VLNTVIHTVQVKTRRAAGHGGRRTTERHGGQADTYATVYYGMQRTMSVAGASAIPYDYWCMGMEDRRRRRVQEAYQQEGGRGILQIPYNIISIITPIASALKNYSTVQCSAVQCRYLELSRSPNGL
jgi:hypothetical protein